MHWQDLVITIGQVIFSVALLPMIFSKDKPLLLSSLVTGTVLIIYALVYTTIQFWFGAIMTAITGALWLILAYQKFMTNRKKK